MIAELLALEANLETARKEFILIEGHGRSYVEAIDDDVQPNLKKVMIS